MWLAREEEVFEVWAPYLALAWMGREVVRGQRFGEHPVCVVGGVVVGAEDHVVVGDSYDGAVSEGVIDLQQS